MKAKTLLVFGAVVYSALVGADQEVLARADRCLLAASDCQLVPGSLMERDRVIQEYNGEKITVPVFRARASFGYSLLVTWSWGYAGDPRFESRALWRERVLPSPWVGSAEEAQESAKALCEQKRSELLGSLRPCQ